MATRGSGSVSARPTRVALVEAAARCRPLDRLASEDLTYRSTYISAYKGSAKVSLILLERSNVIDAEPHVHSFALVYSNVVIF